MYPFLINQSGISQAGIQQLSSDSALNFAIIYLRIVACIVIICSALFVLPDDFFKRRCKECKLMTILFLVFCIITVLLVFYFMPLGG